MGRPTTSEKSGNISGLSDKGDTRDLAAAAIADRIKETLRGRKGGNGSNQHQSKGGNISTFATDTGKTRDLAAAAIGVSASRVRARRSIPSETVGLCRAGQHIGQLCLPTHPDWGRELTDINARWSRKNGLWDERGYGRAALGCIGPQVDPPASNVVSVTPTPAGV